MRKELYSVEQVADLLGLHVRTVRGYIREGRLKATRIGKQYRIAADDLDALTGAAPRDGRAPGAGDRPAPSGVGPRTPAVEVSSIVQVEGVDRQAADRLATLVLAAANTGHDAARPLRVQTINDEERSRMKIVILGDPTATADLLRLLDSVLASVVGDG